MKSKSPKYLQGHVLDARARLGRDIGWGLATPFIGMFAGSALFSLGVIDQDDTKLLQISVIVAVVIIYGRSIQTITISAREILKKSRGQPSENSAVRPPDFDESSLAFVRNVYRFCLANVADQAIEMVSSLRPPDAAYWSLGLAAWTILAVVKGFALTAIFLFILGPVSEIFLRRAAVRQVQEQLDHAAAALHRRLQGRLVDDNSAKFGLYLRAFATTGKLFVQGIDFESAVAYYLAPYMNIIAVGRQGEHVGAGRIEMSDDSWKQNVARLADEANLILLVPSDRPGTLWEILMLQEQGYFGKTIFVMPPELAFEESPHDYIQYSTVWNQARSTLEKHGLQVPEHDRQGILFQLDDSGEVTEKCTLDSDYQIERILGAIRSGDRADGGYLEDLNNDHETGHMTDAADVADDGDRGDYGGGDRGGD